MCRKNFLTDKYCIFFKLGILCVKGELLGSKNALKKPKILTSFVKKKKKKLKID